MHPLSYFILPIAFITALCIQPAIGSADHYYKSGESCKISRIYAENKTREILVCQPEWRAF